MKNTDGKMHNEMSLDSCNARIEALEGALRSLDCYIRHVVVVKHSSVAPCACPVCQARALLPAPRKEEGK